MIPSISSASSSGGYDSVDDDLPKLGSSSSVPMPPPFPGHRWRCLTPGRSAFADVPVAQIAGRYYPLEPSCHRDSGAVDDIVERARRTGIAGEDGIKPLALLLSGMASGTSVPKISVSRGH